MEITLTPQRRDDDLRLEKTGDILTVNGESFDFSEVPDGATLPRWAVACAWLASDVERINGRLHLTVLLPHRAGASDAVLFPDPIVMDGDGPIDLPTEEMPDEQY